MATKKCAPAGPKLKRDQRGRDLPDSMFNQQQIRIGMKVESEHTNNRTEQKRIAKDHLAEDPRYYRALKVMEKALDKTRCK